MAISDTLKALFELFWPTRCAACDGLDPCNPCGQRGPREGVVIIGVADVASHKQHVFA